MKTSISLKIMMGLTPLWIVLLFCESFIGAVKAGRVVKKDHVETSYENVWRPCGVVIREYGFNAFIKSRYIPLDEFLATKRECKKCSFKAIVLLTRYRLLKAIEGYDFC